IRADLPAGREGGLLAVFLPRLHPGRLRRPRHGQVRRARLSARPVGRGLWRRGSGPRLLHHARARRGHRVRAARARRRQDRALGCLLRLQARGRVRARLPEPRRAAAARLGRRTGREPGRPGLAARRAGLGQPDLQQQLVPGDRAGHRRPARQARERARGSPGQRHAPPRAQAGPLPARPRRRRSPLDRVRERSELGRVVAAAGRGGRCARRLDAAARAARLLDTIENVTTEGDVNFVLFLSTNCGDGPFPWSPNDAPATRRAALDAAIAALPPGAAGAFGQWALQSLRPWPCVDWPAPSGGAALGPGPLPDVPVLVLAGDRDIRTPTANAATIASRFRQGHVLVVPGAGHSVLNHSPCAASAVRTWLRGGAPPTGCARFTLYLPPVGAWRRSVAATPAAAGVPGLAGRTVAALVQTIHDAEDDWMLTRRSQETTTGLVGGRLTPDPNGVMRLQAYSSVAGLRVTGNIELRIDLYGDPIVPLTVQYGTLRVAGAGAARGTVTLTGNRLTGTLARRAVSARF